MKKIICGMLAFLLVLSMVFSGNSNVKAATTPELSKSNLTLVKGKAATLKVFDASGEIKEDVEWSSTDPKVATVTSKGRVKAKNVGKTKIFVAVAGKKMVCLVTVESLATNYSNKIITMVNSERTKRGLDKLKSDDALEKAAQKRAEEMAESGKFDYEKRPDGKSFMTVFTDYSIDYYAVAQNIGKGFEAPDDVMKEWMKDDGKRANILTSAYTHIGVGYCNGYWVQLFIKK